MRAVLLVALLVSVAAAAAQTTNWFQVATFEHPGIVESSGLAASRRFPGVLWTHNDDRFQFLFAVNGTGKFIGAFQVPGRLIDWEDIALDNAGNIYIADTGADGMLRSHVAVHRVREPNPYKRSGLARIERSWYVRFP